MSYNSNKAYGNNISYSFSSTPSWASEYAPTSSQMEYSSKTVISYSGNLNTNYNIFFSDNDRSEKGLENNRNYIRNASRKGMGMSKGAGSGRGAGRGEGKGMDSSKNRGGMRQVCMNIPDQFREDQEDKSQLDEIDLAINEIQKTDFYIKKQKKPLDAIIEKLEEKNRKITKKSNN